MALRAVILERIVLSALLTLAAAMMKQPILTDSAPNLGLKAIHKINPVAVLEANWQEENVTHPSYTLTQTLD